MKRLFPRQRSRAIPTLMPELIEKRRQIRLRLESLEERNPTGNLADGLLAAAFGGFLSDPLAIMQEAVGPLPKASTAPDAKPFAAEPYTPTASTLPEIKLALPEEKTPLQAAPELPPLPFNVAPLASEALDEPANKLDLYQPNFGTQAAPQSGGSSGGGIDTLLPSSAAGVSVVGPPTASNQAEPSADQSVANTPQNFMHEARVSPESSGGSPGGGPGGNPGGNPGGGGSTSSDAWIISDYDWDYVGATVHFTAGSDADPTPTFTSAEWDFSYDAMAGFTVEASTTELDVSHAFTTLGATTVAVRLYEAFGDPQLATMAFTVYPEPPEVSLPETLSAIVGQPVTIAATVESEAAIAQWKWEENKDQEGWYDIDTEATDELIRTYHEAGIYEVWLGVTDDYGESSGAMVTITVANAPPALAVTGSTTINEGSDATFTLTLTNPDDYDEPAIYADWEGTSDWELLDQEEFDAYNATAGTFTIRHYYDDDPTVGTNYTAKFWVGDEWGATAEAEMAVQVNDVLPQIVVSVANFEGSVNDWSVVNAGLGGSVTPGTKLIQGLPRMGVTEGIGYEMYRIAPGQNLILLGKDASVADQERLTYQWEKGNAPFTISGNVLSVPVDAERGVLYSVTVTITDGRGHTQQASFKLTVGTSFGALTSPLFAKLEAPTGWEVDLPNPYAPMTEGVFFDEREAAVSAYAIKFKLRLTTEAQEWLNRPAYQGYNVVYHYLVRKYEGSAEVYTHDFTYPSSVNNAENFAFAIPQGINPGQSLTVEAYAVVQRTENGAPVDVLRTTMYNIVGVSVYQEPPEEGDPSLLQQVQMLANLATELPQKFFDAATNLVAALTGSNKFSAIQGLAKGLGDGFSAYFDSIVASPLAPVMTWLLGSSVPIGSANDIPGQVLKYLGLDEESLRASLIRIVGEGNLEALDAVEAIFARLDDPNNPIDLTDPSALWNFLKKPEAEGGPWA